MATELGGHDRFLYRTLVSLLVVAAVGTGMAAVMHRLEAQPDPLNLVVPGLLSLGFATLALLCWKRPAQWWLWVWCGFVLGLIGIATPAWAFTLRAWATGGPRLVDTLPPISAAVLPLLIATIIFAPPRLMVLLVWMVWIAVASPILVYLLAHPAELLTPRGQDLAITLGPVMLMVMLYVPFHRALVARVSQLQMDHASAEALAQRDSLTGLHNRRAGEALLRAQLLATDGNDALILFDIDHFKRINDSHGHPVGDEVLREVAQRCQQRLRKSDFCARWGGEEFLLLVRGSGDEGMLRVAEELREAISSAPIGPAGQVTASFGVTLLSPGDTPVACLQRADQALYAAKAQGRDRVVRA
jgi:diguanylate cyclase (GGDEF)-like protein